MALRVVGAGLPRTGTSSLQAALQQLLSGRCYPMRVIPSHPFDLGTEWDQALAGQAVDWDALTAGFVAAVDWPASLFWRELSFANPDALVLLSTRGCPRPPAGPAGAGWCGCWNGLPARTGTTRRL
jgi:hypothetical protein